MANKKIWLIVLAVVLAVLLLIAFVLSLLPKKVATPQESTEAPTTESAFIPETNPYSPTDFTVVDDEIICITDDAAKGIDVSQHQGDIDWQKVKADGIQFVILRVGGRGWGEAGTLYIDDRAQEYYTGAKAAGLQVGVYFFSQAITPEEAREEARFALAQMEGWELDLPVAFDWEYVSEEARTANMNQDTLTQCVLAFCDEIEKSGKETMLYTNPHHAGVGLDLEALDGMNVWIALYSEEMSYPYYITAWQYTCTGKVDGIEGDVDINLFFGLNEKA